MRCIYCYAEVKEGLKFCTQCGKKLVRIERESRIIEKQTMGNKANENKAISKKASKAVLGLVVVASLILGFLIISGEKSSFVFNTDHIKFLKTLGIDDVGIISDEGDGAKSFLYDGQKVYVYLDKNNGIDLVRYGEEKEIIWDDVHGMKRKIKKVSNYGSGQTQKVTTLEDVKRWYIGQKYRITAAVNNTLERDSMFSDGRIVSNEFYFGNEGGWYDCHYTVWYHVNIRGVPCKGEMRFFLKYKENNLKMWSHSVFVRSTGTRIYREYDERYEKTIEDYYKYLVKNYS